MGEGFEADTDALGDVAQDLFVAGITLGQAYDIGGLADDLSVYGFTSLVDATRSAAQTLRDRVVALSDHVGGAGVAMTASMNAYHASDARARDRFLRLLGTTTPDYP